MGFDRYLESFDDDGGGKEQVALAIYYLETEEENSGVSQGEVRSLIRTSRSTVSPSGTTSYFNRLDEAKWITTVGNDEYRMTPKGETEVEALLDDSTLTSTREDDDLFIDTDDFEGDGRYEQLVADVNECYWHWINDATMVLTRKLFEDMVYQILKIHYGGEDVQMFYDRENTRHYSFDELLDNFREGVPILRQYSRDLNRELVDDLRDLKEEGNTGAHSVKVGFTDEEVEDWSDDATIIAEVLYDTLQGAQIADDG